jgi:hypothetical protein
LRKLDELDRRCADILNRPLPRPPGRQTYRLRNLKIERVDLVDIGANPHAHVTLIKSVESPAARQAREQHEHILAMSADLRATKRDLAMLAATQGVTKREPETDAPLPPVAVDYAKLARLDSGEMARVVKAADARIVRARDDLRAGRVSLVESDALRFTAPEGEPEIARAMHLAEYRERGIIDARGYCVSRGTESRIGEAL